MNIDLELEKERALQYFLTLQYGVFFLVILALPSYIAVTSAAEIINHYIDKKYYQALEIEKPFPKWQLCSAAASTLLFNRAFSVLRQHNRKDDFQFLNFCYSHQTTTTIVTVVAILGCASILYHAVRTFVFEDFVLKGACDIVEKEMKRAINQNLLCNEAFSECLQSCMSDWKNLLESAIQEGKTFRELIKEKIISANEAYYNINAA